MAAAALAAVALVGEVASTPAAAATAEATGDVGEAATSPTELHEPGLLAGNLIRP